MTRIWILLLLAATLVVLAPNLSPVEAYPQDATEEAKAEDESAAEEPEDEETRLRKLAMPAEHHEHLEAGIGEWDLVIRMWTTPDGEPTETRGSATSRWILGGRCVETLYQGEVAGRPFQALRIEGYDNLSEKYIGTWRDTMGTYTLVFRGTCDEECLVRTMTATFTEPTSRRTLSIKNVTALDEDGIYTTILFLEGPS